MLSGLWHDPFVSGDYQQRQVYAADSGKHVLDKPLMAGDVDDAYLAAAGQNPFRALGQAQRAFDLMCQRSLTREAFGGPLAEKQFVRDAIAREIPVLGVCLGAQLIASALGARIYPNAVKEIGWFPIEAVPAPGAAFSMPSECLAFHWHGETFDLPDGAVRIARSQACENQAFQFKRHVVGLQFHLETTPESLAALLDNCRHELVPGPYVQTEAELRASPQSRFLAINTLMGDLLTWLTGPRTSRALANASSGGDA